MTALRTSDARRTALRGPAGVAVVGLAAAALLRLRDPHEPGAYGFCPFQAVTGLPCPGCGGLRAGNLLTHGDVAGAVSSNLLAVALVGVLAVAWTLWVVRRLRGDRSARMIVLDARVGAVVVAAIVVFGVVRTLPFGAWLAP